MHTAPPGFQPFDPDKPVRVYYRNLPHWRQEGATYFLTIHTADSLPKPALARLSRLAAQARNARVVQKNLALAKELYEALANQEAKLMDEGHGNSVFHSFEHRKTMHDALLFFHGERVDLGCFVIMPNHVHLVARMLDSHQLEDWQGSIKRHAARKINAARGRQGSLWFEEGFDRIVRDLDHLRRCVRYIGRNPTKANLNPRAAQMTWINPGLEGIGWRLFT